MTRTKTNFLTLMKNAFSLLALCFALAAHAQQPFAKMVVGLEAGWDLQQYNDGRKAGLTPNVHVEYPFRKFSFGFGLAHKEFEAFVYPRFDGRRYVGFDGKEKAPFYFYENRQVQMNYWSIPLRVSYRFTTCNCVYLHGGVSFDFLDPRLEETTVDGGTLPGPLPTRNEARQFLKTNLRTYELGVGFKLHSSDYFRLVLRPSYVWSENPEIGGSGPALLRSLRLTFGAQYAFVRYGAR